METLLNIILMFALLGAFASWPDWFDGRTGSAEVMFGMGSWLGWMLFTAHICYERNPTALGTFWFVVMLFTPFVLHALWIASTRSDEGET